MNNCAIAELREGQAIASRLVSLISQADPPNYLIKLALKNGPTTPLAISEMIVKLVL